MATGTNKRKQKEISDVHLYDNQGVNGMHGPEKQRLFGQMVEREVGVTWYSLSLSLALKISMAALPLQQQLLCFSNLKTRTGRTTPWLSTRKSILANFNSQNNKLHLSVISCSSSTSQFREANTETAESCVNLGLELFSEGRVFFFFYFLVFLFPY